MLCGVPLLASTLIAALLSCGGEHSPTDPTPPTTTQPPPTSNCAARDISCGASVSDSITASSCLSGTGARFNVHRLVTTTAASVTITATSRNYVISVFLVDRNGNAIAGGVSIPPSDTASITRQLPADTYGIVIMPQPNFLGTYSLSITCK